MTETIQEKTYRLGAAIFGNGNVETFESLKDDGDFKDMCKLVAIAQSESLEEAVKLHSFKDVNGMTTICASDLADMARDLRESVK